jgi:hypothetical protein
VVWKWKDCVATGWK